MKREEGFSLVQVLISIALAGGLSLLLMRQGELQKNITKGSEAQTELISHMELIKLHLSKKEVCEAAFKGTPVPSGNPAVTEVLGSKGVTLLRTTGVKKEAIGISSYAPSSIKLSDFDDDLKIATLSIDYERVGDFFGSKTLTKKVLIRYKGAGTIESCSASLTEQGSFKDHCLELEGFEWNESIEKCQKKDLKFHVSMHTAAGNETKTIPGEHDFCTLTTSGGEDNYKDSTHRMCTVYPNRGVYRKWTLKSELNEGRTNYCNAVCFSFKEPTSTSTKSIYYDPSMNIWDAAP